MSDRRVVGFTGTKAGMTRAQQHVVREQLREWAPHLEYGVHGACVGADDQFDRMLSELRVFRVIRLCLITPLRVFCEHRDPHTVHRLYEPKPPLDRNREIVYEAYVMLATPRTHEEELRSGTWATIRYARKARRHLMIVWPNGDVSMSWKP